MPVRRTHSNGFGGYGVFGQELPLNASGAIIDMEAEAAAIPLPPIVDPNPGEPIELYAISLVWRFSIDIYAYDYQLIKQYHNPSGKLQFGRYVCSAYDYHTDEGFITYARMKSPRYSCAYTWAYDVFEPTIPCDEPQDDVNPTPGATGGFVPYTGRPTFTGNISYTPFPYWGGEIADRAQIFFEGGVSAVRVGVTYMYAIDGLRNSGIVQLGTFVKIVM